MKKEKLVKIEIQQGPSIKDFIIPIIFSSSLISIGLTLIAHGLGLIG